MTKTHCKALSQQGGGEGQKVCNYEVIFYAFPTGLAFIKEPLMSVTTGFPIATNNVFRNTLYFFPEISFLDLINFCIKL